MLKLPEHTALLRHHGKHRRLSTARTANGALQLRDSTATHLHFPLSSADLFEDVCRDHIAFGDIAVPPDHAPLNPEDDDDVVPDQHAAFGIHHAIAAAAHPAAGSALRGSAHHSAAAAAAAAIAGTMPDREALWRDFGLDALASSNAGAVGTGLAGRRRRAPAGRTLALRRREGGAGVALRRGAGDGASAASASQEGSVAGSAAAAGQNGMPR